MIPKIHAKGSSFKGCANYVLHDKDAQTSERVAWTETINLGTQNPHAAWKVMAATSMDQDRLKENAGIKNTGRKSKNHVQHVTLSWHADEAKDLTPDEQIRAARWFLREIEAGRSAGFDCFAQ